MLAIVVKLNAKPTSATAVAHILEQLLAKTKTEKDTLAYAVHRSEANNSSFIVYELYKDRAACEARLASQPVQQALASFDDLLLSPPDITFCDLLGGQVAPELVRAV